MQFCPNKAATSPASSVAVHKTVGAMPTSIHPVLSNAAYLSGIPAAPCPHDWNWNGKECQLMSLGYLTTLVWVYHFLGGKIKLANSSEEEKKNKDKYQARWCVKVV